MTTAQLQSLILCLIEGPGRDVEAAVAVRVDSERLGVSARGDIIAKEARTGTAPRWGRQRRWRPTRRLFPFSMASP